MARLFSRVLLVAFWSVLSALTAWAFLPAIGGALVLVVCILSTPTGAGVALFALWIAFRSIG